MKYSIGDVFYFTMLKKYGTIDKIILSSDKIPRYKFNSISTPATMEEILKGIDKDLIRKAFELEVLLYGV